MNDVKNKVGFQGFLGCCADNRLSCIGAKYFASAFGAGEFFEKSKSKSLIMLVLFFCTGSDIYSAFIFSYYKKYKLKLVDLGARGIGFIAILKWIFRGLRNFYFIQYYIRSFFIGNGNGLAGI